MPRTDCLRDVKNVLSRGDSLTISQLVTRTGISWSTIKCCLRTNEDIFEPAGEGRDDRGRKCLKWRLK